MLSTMMTVTFVFSYPWENFVKYCIFNFLHTCALALRDASHMQMLLIFYMQLWSAFIALSGKNSSEDQAVHGNLMSLRTHYQF